MLFGSELNRKAVEKVLAKVIDPETKMDLMALGAVQSIEIENGTVAVSVVLGYPVASVRAGVEASIEAAVQALKGVEKVIVRVIGLVIPSPTPKQGMIAGVRNIIAVASGKGGVGKSTTAVNLALALQSEGAKVGLLDADIYGPSQPHMLGVGRKEPEVINQQWMQPVEAHGLKTISMGYLVTDKTPMVWRGPMVSSAFQQLVNQTQWGDLDYLVVDMPPGTGDVQLTLSQAVPVGGAVIVTTPQDIALLDAQKGVEMFRKVNVPVLGVVENMAIHRCGQCGHEEHIFGEGGGARIAADYDCQLLGSLPLDLTIREQTDGGNPTVAEDPTSSNSLIYRQIARKVAAALWLSNKQASAGPEIVISDD